MADLLASSKALLELDKENALVPHGLGGHGRTCLEWCIEEIERLRAVGRNARDQMCRAIAPDDAYTDALDSLDAVIDPPKNVSG